VNHNVEEVDFKILQCISHWLISIIGDTALSGIIEDGDTDAQAGPSNIQIEVSFTVGPMVLLLEESEEPGPSIVPSVRQECWWRRC
ncbi:unnamed protein product, partial [Gadus morhua 'NCC']